MSEIIAAGMVIGAAVIGWFANRILRSTPPSEATMKDIASKLEELTERLTAVETRLQSRSVPTLWAEHRDLAKSVARMKADVARNEGLISQLSPLVSRLDNYLRTVQGGAKP